MSNVPASLSPAELAYLVLVSGLLACSGVYHLALGKEADRVLGRPDAIRSIGGCLVVLALPGLWASHGLLQVLGAVLLASGLFRVAAPEASIRLMQRLYGKVVHGILLLLGSLLVLALPWLRATLQ
ncbi:MAG: hypothetical protein HY816_20805 [Candidatus Wallbacteria bacterium]|nr:hypothetical protein [Candidatus Wallbacteria bacterium]